MLDQSPDRPFPGYWTAIWQEEGERCISGRKPPGITPRTALSADTVGVGEVPSEHRELSYWLVLVVLRVMTCTTELTVLDDFKVWP